ncbi:hypothetical protein E2562_019424 [Oryza meyeriana var. granulata]|uniref:Uncharacterized protein n=1 Tax=Oryza meyeriana var. granulata TaxID=110450 RepID=A0A6G1DK87_9ORYZ|nr:hypothetical protein E2562_019424 [Oryza meyeriana var. granulata]
MKYASVAVEVKGLLLLDHITVHDPSEGMNGSRQMELHYINTGFPYTITESFMDFFEGLTYAHADFAIADAFHDQANPYWTMMHTNSYKVEKLLMQVQALLLRNASNNRYTKIQAVRRFALFALLKFLVMSPRGNELWPPQTVYQLV